jgi:hypothetical protein
MRKIVVSLSALLGGMLLVSSAYAARFQGTFDPPFYQGTATFEVPLNCINNDPGENFTFPDDTCGSVDFISALVTHDGDPSNAIHFDDSQLDVVRALRWIDGVLVGLDTDPPSFGNDPIGPQTSIVGDFFNEPQYFLQFTAGSNSSDLEDVRLLGSDPPATVTLFSCPDGFSTCNPVDPEGGPALQAPFVRLSAPEPGSIALIAGALLAGWVARRRRAD